jgi:hypothetical protein
MYYEKMRLLLGTSLIDVANETVGRKMPVQEYKGQTLPLVRAPHRDKTTNSRPKHLKRKQYLNLVKRPQSKLDAKTY